MIQILFLIDVTVTLPLLGIYSTHIYVWKLTETFTYSSIICKCLLSYWWNVLMDLLLYFRQRSVIHMWRWKTW